jgi:hypothetical protein
MSNQILPQIQLEKTYNAAADHYDHPGDHPAGIVLEDHYLSLPRRFRCQSVLSPLASLLERSTHKLDTV